MSMQLIISSSIDNSYSARESSLIVNCIIKSSTPVVVSKRIDIKSAFITNLQDEQNYFGFAQRVHGVHSSEMTLIPGNPILVNVNVLETDDDLSGFIAGQYLCEIELKVYLKTREGFKPEVISSSLVIEILE